MARQTPTTIADDVPARIAPSPEARYFLRRGIVSRANDEAAAQAAAERAAYERAVSGKAAQDKRRRAAPRTIADDL